MNYLFNYSMKLYLLGNYILTVTRPYTANK